MSRSTYKGCKIAFFRDECDVPLPVKTFVPKTTMPEKKMKVAAVTNRFNMLNIDGTEGSSDEENRTPSDNDNDSDDETANLGVSLNFLDSDST